MMLLSGSKATINKLVEAGADVTPQLIEHTFLAACKTYPPAKVFERFSAAFTDRPAGKTKQAVTAREISEAIGNMLVETQTRKKYSESWYRGFGPSDDVTLWQLSAAVVLDPRWLDVALKLNDLNVVLSLAAKGNPELWKFLEAHVDEELAKKKWDPSHMLNDVLEAMIDTGHPHVIEKFVAIVQRTIKGTQHWWAIHNVTRLIPKLSPEAVAPLEALIPFVDKKLTDTLVGALDELKQKLRATAVVK